jgi:hypothetical protein
MFVSDTIARMGERLQPDSLDERYRARSLGRHLTYDQGGQPLLGPSQEK